MTTVIVSDIVEGNGKTVRENNLTQEHCCNLNEAVKIKADDLYWFDAEIHGLAMKKHILLGGCFYVVDLARDCDGTPLYTLSILPRGENVQGDYFTHCASEIIETDFEGRRTFDNVMIANAFVNKFMISGLSGDTFEKAHLPE